MYLKTNIFGDFSKDPCDIRSDHGEKEKTCPSLKILEFNTFTKCRLVNIELDHGKQYVLRLERQYQCIKEFCCAFD